METFQYVLFKGPKRVCLRDEDMITTKIGTIFEVSLQNTVLLGCMLLAGTLAGYHHAVCISDFSVPPVGKLVCYRHDVHQNRLRVGICLFSNMCHAPAR